jgi:DNA-binding SARP family transcriptional activator
MAFNGRTPRKPLLLLKAICAAGGENVPGHQLAGQLWPDADGDAARSAFEMTLSRLRRLLSRDFLLLDEGKVSLNHDLVWLDLWDFESTASDCMRALRARPNTEQLQQLSDDLLNLYGGRLLPAETDEAWLFAARDRTQQLFLRVAFELGNAWEMAGLWIRAAAFYERVVAVDNMAEELHRRLVHCYIESGQHASALIAYRRLQRILNNILGTSPSRETTSLLQRISRFEDDLGNSDPG